MNLKNPKILKILVQTMISLVLLIALISSFTSFGKNQKAIASVSISPSAIGLDSGPSGYDEYAFHVYQATSNITLGMRLTSYSGAKVALRYSNGSVVKDINGLNACMIAGGSGGPPPDSCNFWGNGFGVSTQTTVSLPIGDYKLTAQSKTNNNESQITLSIPSANITPPQAFDFSVSSSGDVTMTEGDHISNAATINLGLVSGATEDVTLMASGGPVGALINFYDPVTTALSNACSPTCSRDVDINLPAGSAGTYTITITAISASINKSTSFTLNVQQQAPAPVPPSNIPTSFLRDFGYTTAETLLFTPSAQRAIRQWALLKGVGAISVGGNDLWQKSAAEVLYVGNMPIAHITKEGDSRYVVAGGSVEYTIHFDTIDNPSDLYSAQVVDTIQVSGGQDGMVSIESATINPNSIDCNGITAAGATISPFLPTSKQLTFNFPNARTGCTFEAKVKLKIDPDIASNTTITDFAEITTIDGAKANASFTTLAIGPFAQERRGGDIYSQGNLNFGRIPAGQFGAKYVLGAGGQVQTTSEQTWILKDYTIRSGSSADFSPDDCMASGTACKTMNDNIIKLKNGASTLNSSIPSNYEFRLNPAPSTPEGQAFYRIGNLGIGDGTGAVTFNGKGTLLVENGDVNIRSNIMLANNSSILGIIVRNGNVIVDPAVSQINAIFYIYSDKTPPNGGQRGSFIVNTGGGNDVRLTVTGAVVASGYSTGTSREGAFQLNRNYVGVKSAIEKAIIDGQSASYIDSLLESSELFLYDGRITIMTPPGFSGKVIGSL